MNSSDHELAMMRRAISVAAPARGRTSPNPWVGAVVEPGGFEGATESPGDRHAEVVALNAAGATAAGGTLFVTLEPCSHVGRTAPCTDAILAAGIRRVVVGVEDPDPRVSGKGIAALRAAGLDVEVGTAADEVSRQLAPYLKHRITGRPWVVLKLAATLDGRTAAPDGTSRWITGDEARADLHRLRAESDAVVVGAGTVRVDDPALTVRGIEGARQPLRVVIGSAPAGARVHPAEEMGGDLGAILDRLGDRGVLQALVEGGPTLAGSFHREGLVDRYVFYLAPVLLGGDDGHPAMAGTGVATIADAWRGRILAVEQLGPDIKIEMAPA